jgi:hypothetical protein
LGSHNRNRTIHSLEFRAKAAETIIAEQKQQRKWVKFQFGHFNIRVSFLFWGWESVPESGPDSIIITFGELGHFDV